MRVLIALATVAAPLVVQGSSKQSIDLFGDSLSDNGNGYAGFAKFILRTNQASFRRVKVHKLRCFLGLLFKILR